MRTATLLLAPLLVTAALAGCLGDDGPNAGLPGNDDGDAPRTEWQYSTGSGTVTGAGTPAGSLASGENAAAWTVPENARVMHINLTVESQTVLGAEISYQLGPACETDPTISCSHTGTTEDGQATITIQDPAPGGWEIYVFLENDAGEADWSIEIATGILAP